MRIIGLCVMGIVLIKLTIYDLWVLPTIGRIIVFILLGIVLLVISFLYQKLRAAIFSDNCITLNCLAIQTGALSAGIRSLWLREIFSLIRA